jgi:AcrR family transcriptional regulator
VSPRKQNLEEILLVEAAEIIATRGLEALSLRELGRRAGVSRAAPYHYFADKAELVARVGELGFRRLGERIAAGVALHTEPLARLRAGLSAYVQFALEEENFFHLMFSGALKREQPGVAEPAEVSGFAFSSDAALAAFGVLVRGVQDAQSQGVLEPGDPLLVVNVLWAYTHGVAVLAQGDHLKHPHGVGPIFEAGLEALLRRFAG